MKKINGLIYFIIFVIYEEIIFSGLVFKNLTSNLVLITLCSIPVSILLNIITSFFKEKTNKVLAYIITAVIVFIFGAQLIYYKLYEAIISVFSIINGAQVTEFAGFIFVMILKNWYGIVLITIPLICLIGLDLTKKVSFEKESLKKLVIKFAVAILIQIIALLDINYVNQDDIYSNKNLYYNTHMPKITANRMGLITSMRLDLKRFIFGFEEKILMGEEVKNDEEKDEVQYNVTEIDFESLIEDEENATIKSMHEYFSNQQPSEKNEYTGMFEGKNLIVFVGEAFSQLAIREDLTPTLYRLYNEGFRFNNFYTPIFPVSTADGEYITDTSLIPKEGVWSLYKIKGNYMPYSYANVFENLGYSSYAYHNHTATYYHRDDYLETMGYDSYLAVGTGLEKRMNTKRWPNSDYDMIDVTTSDYVNDDKFIAYYMTVSGHLNYTRGGNAMVAKNWSLVKDLPYSEKAKSYLAANIELDKAVEKLINELEQSGKLEDTVIVISGDHYPYGLTLDEINELSTYERDNTFEKYHMPLLIWNSEMENPIEVEKLRF